MKKKRNIWKSTKDELGQIVEWNLTEDAFDDDDTSKHWGATVSLINKRWYVTIFQRDNAPLLNPSLPRYFKKNMHHPYPTAENAKKHALSAFFMTQMGYYGNLPEQANQEQS